MQGNDYTTAFVRPPGASFVDAIATIPQPIDAALACAQHLEYVAALRETGVRVQELPPEERFPDACFMQDPALIVDGIAVLNRMATANRFGETELLAELLGATFDIERIESPATLEGGDVLIVGKRLLVGKTDRTNAAGIAQLRAHMGPRGITVQDVEVGEYLHLLTAVTYVGDNVVVVHEDFADNPALTSFRCLRVPRTEAYAANTLGIGSYVIVPAGFPRTSEQLRAEGFTVLPVPMSEFYKADGGVSCLSLIY